eukprot:TRINITY_DN4961_c0_g1_i2.p4 TRINITY_DN4961_c0_g1~~TRINITY_DN4961_c0_g1_i2.p4  ORF type:complete len:124 (-),score=12.96 TRINITY_DN4961_c0_g1_i2:605-976(-)
MTPLLQTLNQVLVVDKSVSLYELFTILLTNDAEELITWNSENNSFDAIITFTNACQMITSSFAKIMFEKIGITTPSKLAKLSFFQKGLESIIEASPVDAQRSNKHNTFSESTEGMQELLMLAT